MGLLGYYYWTVFQSGEGNGNPLQRSCLENPRDGGTSWATVYGVAQSQTWLKPLSSSSLPEQLRHIFPCVYWPSVYLLWRNVYSNSIVNWVVFRWLIFKCWTKLAFLGQTSLNEDVLPFLCIAGLYLLISFWGFLFLFMKDIIGLQFLLLLLFVCLFFVMSLSGSVIK